MKPASIRNEIMKIVQEEINLNPGLMPIAIHSPFLLKSAEARIDDKCYEKRSRIHFQYLFEHLDSVMIGREYEPLASISIGYSIDVVRDVRDQNLRGIRFVDLSIW